MTVLDALCGAPLKLLSAADLGLGDGNQTHIGLLQGSFDGWSRPVRCKATVYRGEKSYKCIALIDPIITPDGSARSPKLRKGAADDLGDSESALSIIRSLSAPGDGLAVSKVGAEMAFLIIPRDRLDLTGAREVRAAHLSGARGSLTRKPRGDSVSQCEYAYKQGLLDDVLVAMEGDGERVTVNRLKRSAAIRDAYVQRHGFDCKACGVSLSDIYGDVANELVEVHHLRPLAEREGVSEATDLAGLVGLCPNCHRVAHRRDPAYTVQEIREFLAAARKRKR